MMSEAPHLRASSRLLLDSQGHYENGLRQLFLVGEIDANH